MSLGTTLDGSTAITDAGRAGLAGWLIESRTAGPVRFDDRHLASDGTLRLSHREALRLRGVIDAAIVEVFGVPPAELTKSSRGKARVALARQAAVYLAHVCCGLSLTDVGLIFARDRTTVAHACAVIEDRRDEIAFDRALELMEWIIPSLAGNVTLHAARVA